MEFLLAFVVAFAATSVVAFAVEKKVGSHKIVDFALLELRD